MKVVGYGICGRGESERYMRSTLDEFKRLCDEVVILCNNVNPQEKALIYEYGFRMVQDNREWGKLQWKIKQDFIETHIAPIVSKGDMLVCLDMDEVFDSRLTKEWLLAAPLDAYHVYIVDLWNDPEHYKPESCFWNVRIWRWNGETKWKQKPVHCGLAPEWAYHYYRLAPFFLKHYGLMKPEDRVKKLERYAKYDPEAAHLDKRYYDMLRSNRALPFDEQKMRDNIDKEFATYKPTKPQPRPDMKKERYAYVKNPHGEVIDIPERHLKQTMARGGFEFVGWAEDAQKEMDELFGDVEVPTDPPEAGHTVSAQEGSYQRPQSDEARELNALNREGTDGEHGKIYGLPPEELTPPQPIIQKPATSKPAAKNKPHERA